MHSTGIATLCPTRTCAAAASVRPGLSAIRRFTVRGPSNCDCAAFSDLHVNRKGGTDCVAPFCRSDDGSICRANSLTIRCTVTVLALALLIGVWQSGVPERAPADTLMQQGAAAMQSGDHARAEALFRRALAADPRSG